MFAGIVVAFAGDDIPDGWVLCDGKMVDRTQPRFSKLFDAIGTIHGGDGNPLFQLPDYLGRFLRGVNHDAVDVFEGGGSLLRDPDADNRRAPGQNNTGNPKNQVGSIQDDSFQSHAHPIHDPGHAHQIGVGAGGNKLEGPHGSSHFRQMGTHWGAHTAPTNIAIQAVGGTETRPKNAYVNWIIKL